MSTEHLAEDLEEIGRTHSIGEMRFLAERVRTLLTELDTARKGQGRWVG